MTTHLHIHRAVVEQRIAELIIMAHVTADKAQNIIEGATHLTAVDDLRHRPDTGLKALEVLLLMVVQGDRGKYDHTAAHFVQVDGGQIGINISCLFKRLTRSKQGLGDKPTCSAKS